MRALLGLALLALPIAACGEDTTRTAAPSGSEPITARAVAAVTAEHLEQTPTAGRAEADDFGYRKPPVGADLDLGRRGADGRLSVMVGTDYDERMLTCEGDWADVLDGCEENYRGGTLMWQEEEPEEDPGILYYARRSGDAMVLVELGGPLVQGDPRDQDLVVPVDTMAAVANDERLAALTTPEAVRAGEALDWFRS